MEPSSMRLGLLGRVLPFLLLLILYQLPESNAQSPTIQPAGVFLLELNETLTLNCVVDSSDIVSYEWRLNDVTVQNDTSPNITISYIDASSVDQGGVYHCTVYDSVNKADSTTNQVFVAFAPLITTSPQSVDVTRGDTVELSCNVTSFPVSTIEWAKLPSGFIVDNITNLNDLSPYLDPPNTITTFDNTTNSNTFNSSILVIESVLGSDFGDYVCIGILDNDTLVVPEGSGSAIDGERVLMIIIEVSDIATITVAPVDVVITPPEALETSNSEVNFICAAEGGPNNTFQWFLNDVPVNNAASELTITSSNDNSILSITPINATQHGGVYTCLVTNAAGNSSNTTTLNVRPIILIQPVSQIFTSNGSNEQLVCQAEAFPSPTYTWIQLDGTDPGVNTSVLRFTPVIFGDEGTYQCIVNSGNEEVNSTTSTVIVSPQGSVSVSPSNNIVSRYENGTFNCMAKGGPDTIIQWIKGNNPLSPMTPPLDVTSVLNTLTIVSNESRLVLESIVGDDGGEYTCIAINEAGFDNDTVTLLVQPEIITQPPQNVYLNAGNDLSLTCVADSFPPPMYQWERMNRTTGVFVPIPAEFGGNTNNLTIPEISYQIYGTFRCVASAPMIEVNSTSNEVLVTVSPEGSTLIDPDFIIVDNGSDITFTCSAQGGPNNTFIWTRQNSTNNFNITESFRSFPLNVAELLDIITDEIITIGNNLTISSINATQDGGGYDCLVINEAGAEQNTSILYVRPVITEQPDDQYVVDGQTITLSCRADSFPAPEYQWEMMNRTTRMFESIENATDPTYIISSISYYDYGKYRCVATANGIAESATSEPALITVSPVGSVIATPITQTVERFSKISFDCMAKGGPDTIYRWIKGRNPLSSTTPPLDVTSVLSTLDIVSNESRLVLESIVGIDGGEYTCIAINEAGFDNDTVTLYIFPNITRQPVNQYVQPGDTVTLYCEADSFPPPTYQWERRNETGNFVAIPGETNTNLTIVNIEHGMFGEYRCVVTTPIIDETATSNTAVITVSANGSVTIDPDFIIVDNGSNITFTCSARGGPNNTFLWFRTADINDALTNSNLLTQSPLPINQLIMELSNITLATGTIFTITSVNATEDGGSYDCYVFNEAGYENNSTTLYVRPVITDHPNDQYVDEGETVILSCRADSFPAPKYQWEMTSRTTGMFQELLNENDSTLMFSPIDYNDFGNYRCIATANGIIENAISLPALVTVSPKSSIFVTPSNQILAINSTAYFNCTAEGGPNTIYRWIKGRNSLSPMGTPLDVTSILSTLDIVSNESRLVLESIVGDDGGEYTCIAINEAGFDNDTVTLYIFPDITSQPENQYVQPGDTVTLYCEADSFPLPTYQWERRNETGNFEDISGETNTNLTITDIEYEQFGDYRCVVTTPIIDETATSNTAVITVSANGSVIIDPDFIIVDNGSNITFTCSARGGPNNTYVWVQSMDLDQLLQPGSNLLTLIMTSPLSVSDVLNELSNITLTTGVSFSISSINATQNGGQYSCVVINEAGIDANTTTLYVQPDIIQQPETVFTEANVSVSLTCLADSYPRPQYRWQKLNMMNDQFEFVMNANESTLSFPSVNYEDYGVYRCVANAEGIVENATSDNAVINVSPAGSVFISPQIENSFNGSTFNLTCNSRGGPLNRFRWTYLRTREIVSNESVYELTSTVYTGGQYECFVYNDAGNDTDTATVNIGPIIITNPTSINVSIDIHNIVLTCEAIGVPIPAITWTHNETVLNLDGGSGDFENDVSVATSTSLGTIRSELTVFSALANNTGDYACNATSSVSFYQSVMSTIALVLVQAVPEIPINLTFSNLTSRNLTLSWVEPHDNNAPILNYFVVYTDPCFLGGAEVTLSVNGPDPPEELFIDNLHPGVTYNFTVFGYNEEGNGSSSQPLSVRTLEEVPSGYPQNLQAITLNATSILVTWSSVLPNETNGIIVNYTIFVNTDVSFVTAFTVDIEEATTLQYQFNGLEEFVNYSFSILASTAMGEGPASPTVTSRTDEAAPADSPQNFTVDDTTPNSISLSWSPPPIEDINGIIDTYIIRYKIIEQLGVAIDPVVNVTNVGGSINNETLMNLENYTKYEISITAVTIGEGPNSTLIQRTDENVPGAPPQNLVAITNSTTSIYVSWEAPPLDMTFGIIELYEIRYGEYNTISGQLMDGTTDITFVNTTDNATFNMTFFGLQEAREYGFQVRAYTVGPGPFTNIVTNTTFPAPPAVAPGNLSAPPANQSEPTSVTLSWDPIPFDEQNGDLIYIVSIVALGLNDTGGRRKRQTNTFEQCLNASGTQPAFNLSVSGDRTSVIVTGLTPFAQYSFNVTGQTSAGQGPTSPSVPFATPEGIPTMPQTLIVTNMSSTSLKIDWTPPSCDNGIRTGYTIVYESIPFTSSNYTGSIGTPSSPITVDENDVSVTIDNLTPNSQYHFAVYAHTQATRFDFSSSNITGTGITNEDAPEEVINLDSINPIAPNINITWTPPSIRNGSFNYDLSYVARQDFTYTSRIQSTSDKVELPFGTTSYVITNVLPFANYTITVVAFNRQFGRMFSSDNVIDRIRTQPISSTNVTNFIARTRNTSSIFVSWGIPLSPNGQITQYSIKYIDNDQPVTTSNLYIAIQNLNAGTTYNITVQPITRYGNLVLMGTISIVIPVTINTTAPNINITNPSSKGISTLTLALPRPSAFGTTPLLFYGVIVASQDRCTQNSNQDLQAQYPDLRPYPGVNSYYITAGWNNATNSIVPTELTIGNKATYSAVLNGETQSFYNAPLSRFTFYCVFVVIHQSTGVPGEILVRYAKIAEDDTRLGYSREALGFFMSLIILLIIVGVVAVIVFIVYRKYKYRIYDLVKRNGSSREMDIINAGGSVVIVNPPVTEPVNGKWVDTSLKEPIYVDNFPEHVANMHSNDDYLFSVEYPTVEPQHHPTTEATHHPDNAVKNRYANITAYDHSRVRLREIKNVPGSDYINANYIDGYQKPNAFIASQGPVPHSINDFWRMIWEQNSAIIVMLTNLEEKGRIKCHLYWPSPDKRVAVYGQIRVQLQEELSLTDHTVRTFSLQHEGSSDERIVKQLHFTAWPDFGVPEHPTPLLRFVHKVSNANPENAGSMIVHCSAGVGRTGTFVSILSQIKRIQDQQTIDIFNFVQSMRFNRCFMVQTEAQYIFIHDALLEFLECGETEVSARDLKEQYRRLGDIIDKEGKTLLENEFEKIQSTIHSEPIIFAGTQSVNRQKNRYANVMPFDKTRVKLTIIPGIDGSDYINGNFIEGYLKGKAFIATQGPLPDTTDDFWRMVWEHKCASIIMLANEREGSKAMCHKYWPDSGTQMYGAFEVTMLPVKDYPDYTLREFKIVDSRDAEGSSQHVKQFQYTSWPSQGVPHTAVGLLDVREQVEKWQRNSGDKPIVVHCSGGCGRTGTYIAICLLIDRLKMEGVVDVFQTVRALRLQRPGMVRSVDQYEFCYKSVLEYLGSFDTYANFSL